MIPAGIPENRYLYVDKTGKRFVSELRENRHGFGQKEYWLYFDGVLGDFTRLPCFGIFDENTRTRGPIISGEWKFGCFSWFCDYQPSRDKTNEIESLMCICPMTPCCYGFLSARATGGSTSLFTKP
jgi:hypothetical protein